MVDTVTFGEEIGGTGETFTSGSDPTTGMGNGGYLTRFFKILANIVSVAAFIATKASEAAASAAQALTAAVVTATSTSNLTLANSGSINVTIAAGKPILSSMYFRLGSRSAPATRWMSGFVTSYVGTTLTITLDNKGTGTGTYNDWDISLAPVGTGGVQTTRQVNTAGLASGGGDLSADRTITVTAASTAQARALAAANVALTPANLADAAVLQQLTDGATIDWDVSAKPQAYVIIAGNRTFNRPTGGQKGRWYYLEIRQDGTGSRLIAWAGSGAFNFRRGGTPFLSTAVSKRDGLALLCTDDTPGANTFDAYFGRDA